VAIRRVSTIVLHQLIFLILSLSYFTISVPVSQCLESAIDDRALKRIIEGLVLPLSSIVPASESSLILNELFLCLFCLHGFGGFEFLSELDNTLFRFKDILLLEYF